MAAAGICSRRQAENLIRAGRVTVNGEPAVLGSRAVPGRDDVRVDGRPVASGQEKVCYLLNKPAGVVTTLRDPQGRPCVGALVADLPWRLFPVGRLDQDSEGLLLLTNDGELAHHLMHPRFHVPKTYVATLDGPADEAFAAQLLSGVDLPDGRLEVLDAVLRGEETPGRARVELTIAEGRKRVVRRALQALGRGTLRLRRIAFGPLQLGDLAPGDLRPLRADELAELEAALAGAKRRAEATKEPSQGRQGEAQGS